MAADAVEDVCCGVCNKLVEENVNALGYDES